MERAARRWRLRRFVVLAWLGAWLVGPRAVAFTPELHERLAWSAQQAAGFPDEVLDVPDEDAAARFREALWRAFASTGDPALRERFLARVPSPASFDARGLKRWLFLNEDRPVEGIDAFGRAAPGSMRLRARAARWPDDDDRNADRFWRLDDGTVRRGADGRPLPDDPAILDMGGAEGVSSQAHARYALLPVERRSDAIEVLETEPWRFSLPRDARASGADFAETYAALAALASSGGDDWGPAAVWFAAAFEGLSWHHVQEAATQTQVVQVPSGDLFVGAQLSVWVEELRSAGGLFGPRVSVREVGVRALTHFHLFHERLFADRVLGCGTSCADAAVAAAAAALSESDASFAAALDDVKQDGRPLAAAAIARLVEAGGPEAKRIHDDVRRIADPSIFAWRGREVTDADDPLAFTALPLEQLEKTDAWRDLFDVRARGFRRFNAFVQRQRAAAVADRDVVRDHLLRRLLDRHEEREARRASFVPGEAGPAGVNKGVVAGLVSLLLLSALAVRSLVRRRPAVRAPASVV